MPDARGNKISCSNYQCEIELTVEILSGNGRYFLYGIFIKRGPFGTMNSENRFLRSLKKC